MHFINWCHKISGDILYVVKLGNSLLSLVNIYITESDK